MTKISVLYPNGENVRFDMPYYLGKHVPLAIELLGSSPGYQGVSVERGLAGGAPDSAPAYVAMCHFLFDSVESFRAAFGPHAAALMSDIPNYTDSSPVIQISEVLLSQ